MSIPPIGGVPGAVPAVAPTPTPPVDASGKGFGDAISSMLNDVSQAELHAVWPQSSGK